jgi:hypothetical protein
MLKRTLVLGGLAAGLALAAGCKKKPDAKAQAAATIDAGNAGAAGAAGTEATMTAAGGEVGALTAVNDCPKSLAGQEKVARTIKKECGPIVVTETYTVDGTLTLEAGAVLKFQRGAALTVGYYGPAKLIVKGTEKEPVTFTSAADAVPGEWTGVRLHDGASRSSIDYLVLEWAGDSDRGALFVDAEDVTFTHSIIRNAKEMGVRGGDKASFAAFTGNTFDKAGKIAVSVAPPAVGQLGAGNTFIGDGFVEVRHGTVAESAKWQNVGAPFHIIEPVNVDGKNGRATLEIAAGTDLRFAPDAELIVGYYQLGAVKIAGTREQPVKLSGLEKKLDGWKGVIVHDSGEGSVENASFESGGSADDRGALAVTRGKLTVKDCVFRGNKLALSVAKEAKAFSGDGLSFEGNTLAVLTTAESFAGLGEHNTYAADQGIELRGGNVAKDATWNLQPGTTVLVSEDLAIDKAILRVAAGSQFAAKEGVKWTVGYYGEASLKLNGTPEKPIKMRGARDEKESWDGILLHENTRDAVLENVQLENVGGEAGVTVKDGRAKIKKLGCNGCAATLSWTCKAKVESADVTGKTIAPTGCN